MLASRLSEDPNVSVLVVEQGPVADTWMSRNPLVSGNIFRDSGLSSTWWSLPVHDAGNRYLQVIQGAALGGSSRINGMLYTRGALTGRIDGKSADCLPFWTQVVLETTTSGRR